LAFKPDIDDLRESPAASIAQKIAANHPGSVLAVEPNIDRLPEKWQTRLNLTSVETALACADVILLLVDHKQFKEISREQLQPLKIVDCRGLWQ